MAKNVKKLRKSEKKNPSKVIYDIFSSTIRGYSHGNS